MWIFTIFKFSWSVGSEAISRIQPIWRVIATKAMGTFAGSRFVTYK